MHLPRRQVLTAGFLTVVAGTSARRLGVAQSAFSVNVLTTPTESGMQPFYAEDRGFFKAAALDAHVQMLSNGGAVVSAVVSGSVDIGQSNIVSLAAAHGRGIDIVLIAPSTLFTTTPAPAQALIVARNSAIKTASDLNGKVVAGNGLGNIMQIAASAWIDKNGGDSGKAKFVEMPFSTMPAALESGRIDAAMVSNPVLSVMLARGARVLGDGMSSIAPKLIIGGWFTTRSWAKAHPDVVARYQGAMSRAGAWANSNPGASAALIAKYTGTPVAPGAVRFEFAERLETALVQPLIDACAKYGTLKATFPATELIASEARIS